MANATRRNRGLQEARLDNFAPSAKLCGHGGRNGTPQEHSSLVGTFVRPRSNRLQCRILFETSLARSTALAEPVVRGSWRLVFLASGLRRAFGQAPIYRGKVLSVVLAVIALFPLGITAFAFVKARELPSSTAAPQVGQKVPDFTLSDTSGKPVSLDQLLAPAGSASTSQSQAQAPKAVLLIFYRGYW